MVIAGQSSKYTSAYDTNFYHSHKKQKDSLETQAELAIFSF